MELVLIISCLHLINTVNSRFKKAHFSFLKLRFVWFKKDLCSESKNGQLKKMPYVGEFSTWDLCYEIPCNGWIYKQNYFSLLDRISGTKVLVRFKTDHVVVKGGFKMDYKQISK